VQPLSPLPSSHPTNGVLQEHGPTCAELILQRQHIHLPTAKQNHHTTAGQCASADDNH
jgi:hypothetical protein